MERDPDFDPELDDDLYDEPAKVRFAHFLRSERKFDGVDALIAQLRTDVERTRELSTAAE